MKRCCAILAIFFSASTIQSAAAQDVCVRPGDLDADGDVDFADRDLFTACMLGPALPPPGACDAAQVARGDFDVDLDLDMRDYAALMRRAGQVSFDYGPERGNLESEQLAMHVSGQLRAPDAEYDRILRDLGLIRAAYPALVMVIDDMDYAPNQLIVNLVAGAPQEGYEALNEFYFVTNIDPLFSTWYVLTFCGNLNANALAPIYAALAEIQFAEPNGFIGTDDQITVAPGPSVWRYSIDDGFHDCFDGCDCHRLWTIDVDEAGVVTLISYQEQGQPWCEF
jgi:hypothetical protein